MARHSVRAVVDIERSGAQRTDAPYPLEPIFTLSINRITME